MTLTWIVGFTRSGCELGIKISDMMEKNKCRVYRKMSSDVAGTEEIIGSMDDWVEEAFKKCDSLIFIGATGIAVRYIAPHLKSKTTDPAVICIDEKGRFVIPLVSGHIGGANDLAIKISKSIGSTPVITTATDINGKFSVDSYAVKHEMEIDNVIMVKSVSSNILAGNLVGISSEFPLTNIPPELTSSDKGDVGIFISCGTKKGPFSETLKLIPRCHIIGIGCKKGVSEEKIEKFVMDTLEKNCISRKSLRAIASIDLKKEEKGLLEFGKKNNLPCIFFTSDELSALPDKDYSESEFVRSITGVDNVCERSAVAASNDGRIILKKTISDGITMSVVQDNLSFDLGDT